MPFGVEDEQREVRIKQMARKLSIENQFPDQWDENQVKALIKHYETQSEDEAVAEDEKYLDIAQKLSTPDSMWAIVRNGKIELINHADLPEGAKLLVTLLPDPMLAAF